MLRIGELASYVGVSTRTVRFYHQRGLLPEPERTPAGYRLYGADAILRLSRIVALASAGAPLARIHDLLEASAEDFAAALAQIDADLGHRISQLKDDRARLKRVRAGDALTLPDIVVRFIDQLRSLGLDPDVVDHYRDSWILAHALYTEPIEAWLGEVGDSMFGDPGYLDLMVRMFQVIDADPESSEISGLADDTVDWMATRWDSALDAWYFDQGLDDPAANAVLDAQWGHKPAWIRLNELILDGLRDRGLDHPAMKAEQ